MVLLGYLAGCCALTAALLMWTAAPRPGRLRDIESWVDELFRWASEDALDTEAGGVLGAVTVTPIVVLAFPAYELAGGTAAKAVGLMVVAAEALLVVRSVRRRNA